MPAALTDVLAAERAGIVGSLTAEDIIKLVPIVVHIGGGYLLDPNEFNGWADRGMFDDNHTVDLGNVGADPSRRAGGLVFPFDVRLTRFYAWHRNNNAGAQAWGWRITAQTKTAASNTVTTRDLLRECTGTGATATAPRDYGNTTNQLTDETLAQAVTAGEVITLGVEAPTAQTTNRYVQVQAGYLQFERV